MSGHIKREVFELQSANGRLMSSGIDTTLSIRNRVPCQCSDCEALNNFLSSKRRQISFKIDSERRKHVHDMIDGQLHPSLVDHHSRWVEGARCLVVKKVFDPHHRFDNRDNAKEHTRASRSNRATRSKRSEFNRVVHAYVDASGSTENEKDASANPENADGAQTPTMDAETMMQEKALAAQQLLAEYDSQMLTTWMPLLGFETVQDITTEITLAKRTGVIRSLAESNRAKAEGMTPLQIDADDDVKQALRRSTIATGLARRGSLEGKSIAQLNKVMEEAQLAEIEGNFIDVLQEVLFSRYRDTFTRLEDNMNDNSLLPKDVNNLRAKTGLAKSIFNDIRNGSIRESVIRGMVLEMGGGGKLKRSKQVDRRSATESWEQYMLDNKTKELSESIKLERRSRSPNRMLAAQSEDKEKPNVARMASTSQSMLSEAEAKLLDASPKTRRAHAKYKPEMIKSMELLDKNPMIPDDVRTKAKAVFLNNPPVTRLIVECSDGHLPMVIREVVSGPLGQIDQRHPDVEQIVSLMEERLKHFFESEQRKKSSPIDSVPVSALTSPGPVSPIASDTQVSPRRTTQTQEDALLTMLNSKRSRTPSNTGEAQMEQSDTRPVSRVRRSSIVAATEAAMDMALRFRRRASVEMRPQEAKDLMFDLKMAQNHSAAAQERVREKERILHELQKEFAEQQDKWVMEQLEQSEVIVQSLASNRLKSLFLQDGHNAHADVDVMKNGADLMRKIEKNYDKKINPDVKDFRSKVAKEQSQLEFFPSFANVMPMDKPTMVLEMGESELVKEMAETSLKLLPAPPTISLDPYHSFKILNPIEKDLGTGLLTVDEFDYMDGEHPSDEPVPHPPTDPLFVDLIMNEVNSLIAPPSDHPEFGAGLGGGSGHVTDITSVVDKTPESPWDARKEYSYYDPEFPAPQDPLAQMRLETEKMKRGLMEQYNQRDKKKKQDLEKALEQARYKNSLESIGEEKTPLNLVNITLDDGNSVTKFRPESHRKAARAKSNLAEEIIPEAESEEELPEEDLKTEEPTPVVAELSQFNTLEQSPEMRFASLSKLRDGDAESQPVESVVPEESVKASSRPNSTRRKGRHHHRRTRASTGAEMGSTAKYLNKAAESNEKRRRRRKSRHHKRRHRRRKEQAEENVTEVVESALPLSRPDSAAAPLTVSESTQALLEQLSRPSTVKDAEKDERGEMLLDSVHMDMDGEGHFIVDAALVSVVPKPKQPKKEATSTKSEKKKETVKTKSKKRKKPVSKKKKSLKKPKKKPKKRRSSDVTAEDMLQSIVVTPPPVDPRKLEATEVKEPPAVVEEPKPESEDEETKERRAQLNQVIDGDATHALIVEEQRSLAEEKESSGSESYTSKSESSWSSYSESDYSYDSYTSSGSEFEEMSDAQDTGASPSSSSPSEAALNVTHSLVTAVMQGSPPKKGEPTVDTKNATKDEIPPEKAAASFTHASSEKKSNRDDKDEDDFTIDTRKVSMLHSEMDLDTGFGGPTELSLVDNDAMPVIAADFVTDVHGDQADNEVPSTDVAPAEDVLDNAEEESQPLQNATSKDLADMTMEERLAFFDAMSGDADAIAEHRRKQSKLHKSDGVADFKEKVKRRESMFSMKNSSILEQALKAQEPATEPSDSEVSAVMKVAESLDDMEMHIMSTADLHNQPPVEDDEILAVETQETPWPNNSPAMRFASFNRGKMWREGNDDDIDLYPDMLPEPSAEPMLRDLRGKDPVAEQAKFKNTLISGIESVWRKLKMSPVRRLEQLNHYSDSRFAALLQPSIPVWHEIADEILKRENMLEQLYQIGMMIATARAGVSDFDASRLTEEQVEVKHAFDEVSLRLKKLMNQREKDLRDVIFFHDERYLDKMKMDYQLMMTDMRVEAESEIKREKERQGDVTEAQEKNALEDAMKFFTSGPHGPPMASDVRRTIGSTITLTAPQVKKLLVDTMANVVARQAELQKSRWAVTLPPSNIPSAPLSARASSKGKSFRKTKRRSVSTIRSARKPSIPSSRVAAPQIAFTATSNAGGNRKVVRRQVSRSVKGKKHVRRHSVPDMPLNIVIGGMTTPTSSTTRLI